MHKNKHIFCIFSALLVLVAASFCVSGSVHAQGYQYVPLATVPIGTSGSYLTQANTAVNPSSYVQNLYTFAFSIAIVIAVVSGVWAGVEYMLSESVTTKSSALGRIKNVGWGFALLICSYLILDIINPQLVTWNLNLGNIDTAVSSSNLAAQEATQSSVNTQVQLAMIQQQTAQQQVDALNKQISACQTMQTNKSSASDLASAGCDSASVASLQTALTTAQTTLTQSQTAASQATAAQQAQQQTAISAAQAAVDADNAQLSAGNLTDAQKQTIQAQLAVDQATLGYQNFQATYATGLTQTSITASTDSFLPSANQLKTNVDREIANLSAQLSNATGNANLQTTLNTEIAALQSKSADLQTLIGSGNGSDGNVAQIAAAAKNVVTMISSTPSPTPGQTAQAYEQTIQNQKIGGSTFNISSLMQGAVSSVTAIKNSDVQAVQSAYVAQQNAAIQAAIVAKCKASFSTGC